MDEVFDNVEPKLSDDMEERAFYRLLSEAVRQVGCGHTDLSYSEETRKNQLNKYLPLKLWFNDDRAFFIQNYSGSPVPLSAGTEITSINGISMDSIIEYCLQVITTDGSGSSGPYNSLNSYFWYIFSLYFESTDEYEVEYVEKDDSSNRFRISALPRDEMFEIYFEENQQGENSQSLILEVIDNGSAILTIRQFFDWRENGKNVKFEKRLKEIFEEIETKKVKSLIIDIRENGGGKVPWVLYSYFVGEEFRFAKSADFIYSKDSPYIPYQKLHPAMKYLNRKWLHTWMPGSSKMSKLDSSRFELTGLYMTKDFKPSDPGFNGQVYILINGGTFSAASDFASMMKSSQLATLIGQETDGGYYGNTSMEKSYVTLPHSKFSLEIPLVRHQLNVNENMNPFGRGVIPDYPISYNIEAILEGKDLEMMKAKSLINNPTID